jgi:hypothetical protein
VLLRSSSTASTGTVRIHRSRPWAAPPTATHSVSAARTPRGASVRVGR